MPRTAPASPWQADAAAFLAALRENHPRPTAHAPWSALERAAAAVPAGRGEAERATRMAALAAMVGDGHTVMPLLDLPFDGVSSGPSRLLLPLRFEQFDDGLFVVGAATPYRALLGRRVEAIGGVPTAMLLERARALLPRATPRFAEEYAPEWLMADLVLAHAGAWDGQGPVRVRAGGVEIEVALRPKAKLDWLRTRTAGAWPDWIAERDPAPLSEGEEGAAILRPGMLYWKIVELRPPAGGAWSDTLDTVIGQWEAMQGKRLILDLRDTIGGDGTLVPALIARLDRPELRVPGGLVVLIGRRCHSACVMLVSALEKRGQLTFAGQPTGDAPNHVGETNLLVLPNSGLPVIHASRVHQTSHAGDRRPFKRPDVALPLTHADFAAGRDAAVAWALNERLNP